MPRAAYPSMPMGPRQRVDPSQGVAGHLWQNQPMQPSPVRSFLLCCLGVSLLAATEPVGSDQVQGTVSLNARLRYEGVEQTGLRDANALTLRTRLGFTSADYRSWQFMLEAENITAADGAAYNQAGLNPGGLGKAVVADPETTELNQAWVAFTQCNTTLHLGRQRLVLDNARFVGDVGWRQNQQTFDALVVRSRPRPELTLTYAYLDRINRVLGRDHPQGRWSSDSHLLNASLTTGTIGKLTGYAYLLDFRNATAQSNMTFGVNLIGKRPAGDGLELAYRAELAWQADYGGSARDYATQYSAVEVELGQKIAGVAIGGEVLGADNGVGFHTPLATLHAFNGWADLFGTTPAAGLRDAYVRVRAAWPGKLALTAFYHRFSTDDGGVRLGDEIDVQLTRALGKRVTGLVKYANFRHDAAGRPDVRKIWIQAEYHY